MHQTKGKNFFRLFPKTRGVETLHAYKLIRNRLNSDIKNSKFPFFQRKLENSVQNSNRTWQVFRLFTNAFAVEIPLKLELNGKLYSRKFFANLFNENFVNVGAPVTSSENQPERQILRYIPNLVYDSIFIPPTSQDEVISILNSLDNRSAACEDNIKALPIRAVADNIAKPLIYVFNQILTLGIFPQRLKIPRVTLCYKDGRYTKLNNYSPI